MQKDICRQTNKSKVYIAMLPSDKVEVNADGIASKKEDHHMMLKAEFARNTKQI